MIQRIQTVFLLFATALLIAMFFLPLAHFTSAEGELVQWKLIGIFGEKNPAVLHGTLPLFALISVVVLLSVIAISLFKNRKLQMRLCIYNILVIIGYIGLVVFYFFQLTQKGGFEYERFNYAAMFPLFSLILVFLAFRNIKKDDEMVKSLDRIR
jgi:hypothetical protein